MHEANARTTSHWLRQMAPELAARAKFTLFDGQQEVGRLPLEVWEDSFMTTFKLPDYQPPSGRPC